MDIVTRPLSQNDKENALWVEAGAMPNNKYLTDVWDMFTSENNGNLLGAFVGNTLAGIGKITRLYGDYGWLETLRVHPDWQRKGIGTAIWKQYFIEMEEMKLKSVGMYTEDYNVASKTLGESFGLKVKGFYTEFQSSVDNKESSSDFQPVSKENGEEILSKHYANMPPYIIINRTFYPVAAGLGEYLSGAGWLYSDGEGNVLIVGNRFHPQRLLHVPYFSGHGEDAISFVKHLGRVQNAPTISCLVPTNSKYADRLKDLGFNKADTFMTLWIDL